ncbi:MAG: hypothetical protein ACHQAU_05570 [Gammaproteobacteria bacterium]|nr:hypothetical protein [Gammaproteobacteria bacterium]
MRPMTFINGVIFGSTAALAVVLVIIIFFRWVLTLDTTLDQTVVLSDLPLGELLRDMVIFLALAALAGAGFLGELFHKPWRGAADYLLAVAVIAVIVFFFADPAARLRELVLLVLVAAAGAVLLTLLGRLGFLKQVSAWLGE